MVGKIADRLQNDRYAEVKDLQERLRRERSTATSAGARDVQDETRVE
jgi:hypothetical protein